MAETPESPTNGNGSQPPAPAFDERLASLIADRAAKQVARMMGASLALERQQLGRALHGKSFYDTASGVYKRDLYDALGYEDSLTVAYYRGRYRRGGVAKRIVVAPASATWSGGFDLIEDPDPGEQTAFEAAAVDLFARLGVWGRILRADILAGLGRFGVLYIGAPGDDKTELKRVASGEQIYYLTALAEDRAEVLKEVEDPNNPRYGLPELYRVKTGSGLTGQLGKQATVGRSTNTREVHWTRIIHVADGLLEDDVCGEPRLEPIWNLLDDLDKIAGGGAEAVWLKQKPKFALKIPAEAQTTDPKAPNYFNAEAAEDEATAFVNSMRPFMRLQGVEVENIENTVPSIAPNADAILKLISATTGIPERILTGSERGELASSQDRSNWADRIQERRRFFGEPLVRALVDRLIQINALPTPAEPYIVAWPEIDELNEAEKAEVSANIALANQRHFEAEGTVIVGANEIRDRVFGMEPLDEIVMEDEPEAEREADQEEEEAEEQLAAARFAPSPARLRAAKRRLRRRARPPKSAALRAAADRIEGRPRRPELAIVHNAADRNVPRLVALFLALWAAMASAIPAEALESALRDNDAERASAVVARAISATEQEWRERVAKALQAVLVDAGEATAAAATRRGSWLRAAAAAEAPWDEQPFRAAAFEAAFDAVDPLVARWAATQAGALITEIGPETRLAVRELITSGITQGIPPAKLAGQIREVVGLRSDQVSAIYNLKGDLILAKPGALVTRFPPAPTLRTQPGFRVRIPKGGLTEAQIDKHLARYREMQHNLRARTIARTETMRSAAEGQKAAWRQAIESGQLPKDQKRVWITAGDSAVRDEHAALEGEVVGINEPFSTGIEPSTEPNCRCVEGLATVEDLERAGLS